MDFATHWDKMRDRDLVPSLCDGVEKHFLCSSAKRLCADTPVKLDDSYLKFMYVFIFFLEIKVL